MLIKNMKLNCIIQFVFSKINLLVAFVFIFYSCGDENKKVDIVFTESMAMDSILKLNPEDGARFYKENRTKYVFFDDLYSDSVVPILASCNYYELKKVRVMLKNTPCYEIVDKYFQSAKEQYSSVIYRELKDNSELEKQIFNKIIIPIIEMSVDSMLDDDIDEVFSSYAGGFMNYRKLNFLFGRDRNDFKEMFWEKLDTAKYQEHIKHYVQTYLDTVSLKQNEYCMQVVNHKFDSKMIMTNPTMRIGLTKSTLTHIQKYTSGQTDEILVEAVKDYVVPLALAGATGGISTLYDIGNTVYDVKVTIDDIKAQKVDPDDMVKYVCAHDLSYQIENYYLPKCKKKVYDMIDDSNKKLYEFIISNL